MYIYLLGDDFFVPIGVIPGQPGAIGEPGLPGDQGLRGEDSLLYNSRQMW